MNSTQTYNRRSTKPPSDSSRNDRDESSALPLDEDEQEIIIWKIQQDILDQQEWSARVLSTLCMAAALVVFCSCCIHDMSGSFDHDTYHKEERMFSFSLKSVLLGIFSASMHLLAARIARGRHTASGRAGMKQIPQEGFIQLCGIIGASLLFMFELLKFFGHGLNGNNDKDFFELSFLLAVVNMLTMGGAILLRRDVYKSLGAVKDLEGSKYRFKSL
mmetsp:Transcript_1827/g.2765  ORF Transcript_1827/g.2765 Transcript_1827/m.2765 type:complete len:217 (-) Transcript_1827:885-1535(-)|eukprot:CAMPEP_0195514912 /NCGR_PEP_ID=MMETSP0794_2-20130614/6158_1 /TAXON_ID=515487 /ORGANISM="Stephanopyxis turris, Strain CCMP 815" /LENGTH=216 /DNA_ID=CAMNT_0040643261 /DNA_START=100 /DNA_END=750 /DNA_ORIENTATION=-